MAEFQKQLDDYRPIRPIALDGMSHVYLAEDVNLKRQAVVKILSTPPGVEKVIEAHFFLQAAQIIARLSHPNIVQVYFAGFSREGQPYIAMQYIEGNSLEEIIKKLAQEEQLMPLQEALGIIREIATALDFVHRQRLAYNEIKPHEILLGANNLPVLISLDLVVEQRDISPNVQDNLYQLCLILYQLLTGIHHEAPYYPGESVFPIRKLRPDLPSSIVQVIETGLEKDINARYQSASLLVEALNYALSELSLARIPLPHEIKTLNSQTQAFFLDVVIPRKIFSGKKTELVAQIRRKKSPGLRALVDRYGLQSQDITSHSVKLQFPVNEKHQPKPIFLSLKPTSPDFETLGQIIRFILSPDTDSVPFVFWLAPNHTGELSIFLEVYNVDEAVIFSTKIQVKCQTSEATALLVNERELSSLVAVVETYTLGGTTQKMLKRQPFVDVKQSLLVERKNQLIEEYKAIASQLGRTVDESVQLRLKRHAKHLEAEIGEIEGELEIVNKQASDYKLIPHAPSAEMIVRAIAESSQATLSIREVIVLKLDTYYATFVTKRQERFIHDLSQILNIGPEGIQISIVERGSVMLTLYMPESSAIRLIQKILVKDPVIEKLGISEAFRFEIQSSEQPLHPSSPKQAYHEWSQSFRDEVLRLELLRKDENEMVVRGMAVPGGGQPRATVPLPYSLTQLPAILKALDVGAYDPKRFKPAYAQALADLGLLHENRLHPDFHARVGQTLYQALFAGEIGDELRQVQRSQRQGQGTNHPILCQLQFDPKDVVLTQFPWELIHDDTHFCVPRKNGIAITRSIVFAAPPPALKLAPPLRVLLISPRPQGENALIEQATAVQTGLTALETAGQVTYQTLTEPTWAALEDVLYRQLSRHETFDIIHFDGHGSFARECPACGQPHYPSQEKCVKCQADMRQAAPQGYLHFEDEQGNLDRVNLADMQTALADSEAQLIFLSACGSGVTHGVSVFNGIAPALIRLGIPAVVAMQASPPEGSSTLFVQRFYDSLAQGIKIEIAVGNGRRAIFRPQAGEPVSWFMPVVYLRKNG
jgi:serine/threonine protein kinase